MGENELNVKDARMNSEIEKIKFQHQTEKENLQHQVTQHQTKAKALESINVEINQENKETNEKLTQLISKHTEIIHTHDIYSKTHEETLTQTLKALEEEQMKLVASNKQHELHKTEMNTIQTQHLQEKELLTIKHLKNNETIQTQHMQEKELLTIKHLKTNDIIREKVREKAAQKATA